VLLRDVDRVADVVAVPVRDRDDVGALGLAFVLRALRVSVQERIDVDALTRRRVEAEGGVPEPGERCLCNCGRLKTQSVARFQSFSPCSHLA